MMLPTALYFCLLLFFGCISFPISPSPSQQPLPIPSSAKDKIGFITADLLARDKRLTSPVQGIYPRIYLAELLATWTKQTNIAFEARDVLGDDSGRYRVFYGIRQPITVAEGRRNTCDRDIAKHSVYNQNKETIPMLDLSPETESRLSEYAAKEGVSTDEAINRLLRSVALTPAKPDNQVASDDPVLAFLQTRIAEAENATPEEVAKADEKYQQWQQNMDEPRWINGERLLFPEVTL